MLHIFWAERYGVNLPEERQAEVQIRSVDHKLARLLELDTDPLAVSRPPERRLVGNCRDFSVMLCAMLRHQGVPVRACCGFGAYFLPNHYEDHWVCEVWNAEQRRWVMVDAQLDAFQREVLDISFDPLDVPPQEQFITGGRAWQMCRSGQADPAQFGIFDMHGLGFVAGDLIRDFLALNKLEILPWDPWGGMFGLDETPTAEHAAELDHVAALTLAGDVGFAGLCAAYETGPCWQTPAGWPM